LLEGREKHVRLGGVVVVLIGRQLHVVEFARDAVT